MLAEPSLRAEQVNQMVSGETAVLLEASGEWRRVRADLDAYEGWVHAGYLHHLDDAAADRWREADGWSQGAAIRCGDQTVRVPLRGRVAVEGETVRLADGRRGRLLEGAIARRGDAVAAARGKAPERWALQHFAGASYQWGGVTPHGVDCSGLVQTTFQARGLFLPRDSSQQIERGAPVPPDEIRPGDLLFFHGDASRRITHVAFAGEADSLVHSTVACGGVLSEPWLPGTRAGPLRERLVAVRRMEER
jgi:hypothetical protein